MPKDLAIVLTTAGVNSAVATALAAQRFRTVLLHAEVAERAAGSRREGAHEQQVAHFKPFREHVLAMPFLAPPAGDSARAREGEARPTGVAAKLAELLPLVAVGARFAAHYGASALYLGLRVGAGPAGADRQPGDDLAQATEYIQVWDELLQMTCGLPDLHVLAPLLELETWQVVDLGFQAGVPFESTWSCDEDGPDPCWACRGCRAREAAFQRAAKPDPLRGKRR